MRNTDAWSGPRIDRRARTASVASMIEETRRKEGEAGKTARTSALVRTLWKITGREAAESAKFVLGDNVSYEK